MIISRSISRALFRWMAWRAHRRLYAAMPSLRELDTRKQSIARQHRAGGREIEVERRRLVTARLALECGRH